MSKTKLGFLWFSISWNNTKVLSNRKLSIKTTHALKFFVFLFRRVVITEPNWLTTYTLYFFVSFFTKFYEFLWYLLCIYLDASTSYCSYCQPLQKQQVTRIEVFLSYVQYFSNIFSVILVLRFIFNWIVSFCKFFFLSLLMTFYVFVWYHNKLCLYSITI